VAWESSQPHVEARGSSQPHVEAWGSSQPHVVARAYVQASLRGRGIVATATAKVALLLSGGAKATGGQQTTLAIDTPADWCDYYGVEVTDDVAILYKALNDDFTSPRGMSYAPGTIPEAPDWDGLASECGGGLHFSPTPAMAFDFHSSATRFAACPVRLSDLVVHPDPQYPQKIKGRACCAPCYEVDRQGHAVVADALVEVVA